jgi:pilus assembly protein CpaB
MARIRVFLVLALAVMAGGVFAYGTYNYVQKSANSGSVAGVATKPVVVAANDLEVGAEIAREDVKVVQWPATAMPPNAIGNPNDVIGRGLVLSVTQNEPFLPLKLASKEAGSGLPPAIPPGLRAVSVRVNEVIGVAGYVLPGTFVDVLVTLNPAQQQQAVTSKVILTNVQVLAAGTRIDRETDKNKPVAVTVVTLLVDPVQSERLTLASTEGKIQLALRNPMDKETPVTPGVRPAVLLGSQSSTPKPTGHVASAKPAAPSLPEAPTVEIIRGDKRAREVVGQE